MLTLVMKYDLRSCFRRALPHIGSLFVLAVFAMGLLYFSLSLDGSPIEFIFTALYFMCVTAMAALFLFLLCLGAISFYRTLFTGEGYLFMSLPIKSGRLVNAKIMSALIYECAILIIGILALVIASVLPASLYDYDKLVVILRTIVAVFLEGIEVTWITVTLSSLGILTELIAQTVILLSSITVGSLVAERHRVLLSLGVFLGINLSLGVVELIFGYIIRAFVTDPLWAVALPLIFELALIVAICVLIYCIGMRLMSKRFNVK